MRVFMKNNKRLIISLIAAIISISIICIISIAYNFLGGFYYCRVIEYNSILGEEQTIEVSGEGAFTTCCNFSGSLVVNTNINQPIFVKTISTKEPLYLRAKFGIINIEIPNGKMFGYTNWVQATDGYLYFNQPIMQNEKVGLASTITSNVQQDLKSSENYIMYFIVEASKTPYEYEAV